MQILTTRPIFLFAVCLAGSWLPVAGASGSEEASEWRLFVDDPLTSGALVPGESRKEGDGAFSEKGWRALDADDYLKIELGETAGFEGKLEIRIANVVWRPEGVEGVKNRKIHFLNMFSNELGDHHAEDGGGPDDALWTLRLGIRDGEPRYGSGFKVLWSPVGAKRSPGSRYHERVARPPEDWEWRSDRSYVFSVSWSSRSEELRVEVDGVLFGVYEWAGQKEALDTIFIGKAADFQAWVGPEFSDLKVWTMAGD